MNMRKEPTWKAAITEVLEEAGGPLHYEEITEKIAAKGIRKNLGATPAVTVAAQLSTSINNEGPTSPFARVLKGTYGLKKWGAAPPSEAAREAAKENALAQEEQYGVITSFGMFWQRKDVDWRRNPRLWGMQQIGAVPVEFSEQLGIYLLYDAREIIYVGRSTERPLGRRLFEHTVDRLSTRWDRFSWFGVRPVNEDGRLGEIPENFSRESLVPALEAVLIEALEPRQNRKRGDDLISVEYMQKQDEEIERRLIKTALENVLANKKRD